MTAFRSDIPAIYHPDDLREGEILTLTEEEARHLRALRLHPGDDLQVLNGRGVRAMARIELIDRRTSKIRITTIDFAGANAGPYIVASLGILSDKSRFEWFVEKAVELGASEIIPLLSERAEGRFNRDRAERIAVAALKQSQRLTLPVIREPLTLPRLLDEIARFDRAFICHESAAVTDSLAGFLRDSPRPGSLLVMVGPEGGFSEREVELARDASATVASLGEARLRAETAALVALTLATSLLAPATETIESVPNEP